MRSVTASIWVVALLGCASASGASSPSASGTSSRPAGPFASQKLAIADRTPTGFTAEVQLELDNQGPGTLLIHTADFAATVGDLAKKKGDLVLDQTAEAGERQGVVVPVKIDLKDSANELGAGNVTVRVTGALHVSQRGDRDLRYDVSVDVPGQTLVAR